MQEGSEDSLISQPVNDDVRWINILLLFIVAIAWLNRCAGRG